MFLVYTKIEFKELKLRAIKKIYTFSMVHSMVLVTPGGGGEVVLPCFSHIGMFSP